MAVGDWRLTWHPEGADPVVWDFQPNRLDVVEAEEIEIKTGFTLVEWAEKVMRGSMLAVHALLWVLRKRADPTLRYDDVRFCAADVEFELVGEDEPAGEPGPKADS